MLEWPNAQLISGVHGQPTLLGIDLFIGHKTGEVIDTIRAHHIVLSVILGGCTGLVQLFDILTNRTFKDILKVSYTRSNSFLCFKRGELI